VGKVAAADEMARRMKIDKLIGGHNEEEELIVCVLMDMSWGSVVE
jgi:hypothetical protein